MELPQLTYAPTSQNQRVEGFETPSNSPFGSFCLAESSDAATIETVIQSVYRQILNEQQMLASNRLVTLESQLKNGAITVKDFVRGVLLSSTFRTRNYDVNNNYRFVRMCVQRVLGREVYGDREELSWSIVLATKGLQGFVDELLSSAEYNANFGDNTVPYQRRRILPQQAQGQVTFAHMPRYAEDHLAQLQALGNDFSRTGAGEFQVPPARWDWQQQPYAEPLRKTGAAITIAGAGLLGLMAVSVVLSWFGFVHL